VVKIYYLTPELGIPLMRHDAFDLTTTQNGMSAVASSRCRLASF
jgi:hypothetical protein